MYTFETKVRYSECTPGGHAGLASVLDYLQDTCTFQAEELSVGVSYLQERHLVWLLSSWQVDIARYPVFGETIRISTWPYDFYGFYGFRNFCIRGAQGEILVRANSVWVFMDLRKGRPSKLPPEITAAYEKEERLEMEYLDRKIPDFEAEAVGTPFKVPHYFIDTNRHMNNAKYVLLAEEILPPAWEASRIRAEYRRSAVCGDLLYPYADRRENKISLRLCDAAEKPYAVMELYGHSQKGEAG